ncbi:serine hydrolase domain-containing protein [Streptomyces sp. NPDC058525]|uniref:serine hydrolase domain-containing protein n=1 Tax=Streptomyces sp. NPDC058525 TaxID=3346538 RepID=UPI00364FEAC4
MNMRHAADLLSTLAREHAVPGAQLAVDTGTEVFSVATGVTRSTAGVPVEDGTAFAYGSVTKAFTATLVLQLASDGDIGLDDPLADSLAEFRRPKDRAAAALTARQLLSHTAGLVSDHQLPDPGERSLFRYAASVAALPLLLAPGTSFSYANTGYNLLGRLVEEVTGTSWQTALGDFLLGPLGIRPHFLHGSGPGGRVEAEGHAVRPGEREARPVGLYLPPTWAPAGGLCGSARDLLGFARLHTGAAAGADTLLGPRDRAAMHTPQPAADAFGMADGWTLGLARYGADGQWLGHDGTVDGATCHLRFHPASGAAVALTTNATTGTRLWPELLAELRTLGLDVADYTGARPESPQSTESPAAGRTPADPAPLYGDYANGDTVFSVRPHGDGIRLSDPSGLLADLELHDGLRFSARRTDTAAAPYPGRFVPDPATGAVDLMQLAGRSATRLRGVGHSAA